MTNLQIIQHLKHSGKSVSLTHFFRLSKQLKIKPAGRSRPQRYPADAAQRILNHLGIEPVPATTPAAKPRPSRATGTQLVSVKALRAAKPATR